NPASADLVERPPVRYSGDFQLLTAGQVFALARAADPPQDGALYITAAFTGLRLGELLALRWRDIDWGLQRIQVRRNYTDRREKVPKSGRVRSAPMVDEVMVALDGLSRREHFTRAEDLVFCSVTGGHLEAWGMRRRFYAALERRAAAHRVPRPAPLLRLACRPKAATGDRPGLSGARTHFDDDALRAPHAGGGGRRAAIGGHTGRECPNKRR